MKRAKFPFAALAVAATLLLGTPLMAQPVTTTSLEARFTTIRALSNSGEHARAETAALAILPRARRLARREPLALAEVLRLMGHALSDQGKSAQAVPYRREAVAVWGTQVSGDDPRLAKAIANLASALDDATLHRDEASRLHAAAIAMQERAEPNTTNTRAGFMLNYANHQIMANQETDAAATLTSAILLIDADPAPELTTKIVLLHNLSNLQNKPGQLEAMLQTRQAIVDVYGLMGPEAVSLRGEARIVVGEVLTRLGRDALAEAQMRLAVADFRQASPPEPALLSKGLQLMAAFATSQGRGKEAQFIMVEALYLLRTATPAEVPYERLSLPDKELRIRLVSGLGTQGMMVMAQGEREAGEALYLEALALGRDLPLSARPVLIPAQFGLGFLRVQQEKYPEGIALLEVVVTAANQSFGADDPYALYLAQQLALGRIAADQVDEGVAEITRIRDVLMAQPPGWNPRRSDIRQTYGDLLMVIANHKEAYVEFRDVGFELLAGPGKSASLDAAVARAFVEGRGIFVKQIQAGWNAGADRRGALVTDTKN